MSEPKFSVGQRVAVCTSTLGTVIPVTTVVSSRLLPAGSRYQNIDTWQVGVLGKDTWAYTVADAPHQHEFAEWCLRPLNDDDYTESTDELERTA